MLRSRFKKIIYIKFQDFLMHNFNQKYWIMLVMKWIVLLPNVTSTSPNYALHSVLPDVGTISSTNFGEIGSRSFKNGPIRSHSSKIKSFYVLDCPAKVSCGNVFKIPSSFRHTKSSTALGGKNVITDYPEERRQARELQRQNIESTTHRKSTGCRLSMKKITGQNKNRIQLKELGLPVS